MGEENCIALVILIAAWLEDEGAYEHLARVFLCLLRCNLHLKLDDYAIVVTAIISILELILSDVECIVDCEFGRVLWILEDSISVCDKIVFAIIFLVFIIQ